MAKAVLLVRDRNEFWGRLSLVSTGTVLGLATIPMVALTAASAASAVGLIMVGDANLVALGAAAVVSLFGIAALILREDDLIADQVHRAIIADQKALGYFLASVSSGMVPAVVMVFSLLVLRYYLHSDSNYPLLTWFWSYGVATGAWSLRAHLAEGRQRTLSSIQAYAGHVGYFAASVAVAGLHCSIEFGIVLLLIPQILPFAVGFFLAMADRNALRDVQI